MSTSIQQGVPQLSSPVVTAGGVLTQPWYLFFINLWNRTGGSQNTTSAGFLTGEIKAFAGAAVPSGFLQCDGSAVSRSTYANLYGVIGNSWGAGNGSTTFNLPSLGGRTIIGAGGTYGLGSTGGAATYALTVNNLASHNHNIVDPGHNHSVTDPGHLHTITDPGHTHVLTDPGHHHSSWAAAASVTAGTAAGGSTSGNTGNATTGISVQSAITGITGTDSVTTGVANVSTTTGVITAAAGSGAAFSILPPYAAANWIIKT